MNNPSLLWAERPSLRLYPSGRFTVNLVTKRTALEEYSAPILSEPQQFAIRQFHLHGLKAAPPQQNGVPPLGLSIVSKSVKPRKTAIQGQKGITSRGRTLAREGAFVLERDYGRGNLVFFTGTLPPAIEEPSGKDWDIRISKFIKNLRYRLAKHGLPDLVVAVTEIQEKRYAETGRPAKHIHLICVGRHPKGKWALDCNEWQNLWSNANANDNANVNWNASTNVIAIKKSAANYIGKYMSKGTQVTKKLAAENPELIPRRWYKITNQLRSLVKKGTQILTGELVFEFLNYWRSNDKENLWFIRPVTIPLGDGQETTVGFWGALKPESLKTFRHFLADMQGHIQPSYECLLSTLT